MYFVILLEIVTFVFYLALTAGLVHKYIRTRDLGFVWLGVAAIIWPLSSGLLIQAIERRVLFRGPAVKLYPFTFFEHGQMSVGSLIESLYLLQHLIEIGLVLVAVLYLCRARQDNSERAIG